MAISPAGGRADPIQASEQGAQAPVIAADRVYVAADRLIVQSPGREESFMSSLGHFFKWFCVVPALIVAGISFIGVLISKCLGYSNDRVVEPSRVRVQNDGNTYFFRLLKHHIRTLDQNGRAHFRERMHMPNASMMQFVSRLAIREVLVDGASQRPSNARARSEVQQFPGFLGHHRFQILAFQERYNNLPSDFERVQVREGFLSDLPPDSANARRLWQDARDFADSIRGPSYDEFIRNGIRQFLADSSL